MNQTTNLGLTQYEASDKFKITGDSNSLNKDMQIIDEHIHGAEEDIESAETEMNKLEDGIAYRLSNTNTTGTTLAVGRYVWVEGNTNGVADGMYKVSTQIAVNGSLTNSNLVSVTGGVSNSIYDQLGSLSDQLGSISDKVGYVNKVTNLNDTSLAGGGYYYDANNANAPSTTGGKLIQIKAQGVSSWGGQIAVGNSSDPDFYMRSITSSGFSAWRKIPYFGGNGNPGNANDATLVGTYFARGNACTGLPTSGTEYYSFACFCTYQIASTYDNNGSQNVYTRYYINNQWYPWTKIGGTELIFNGAETSSGTITLTREWTRYKTLYICTHTNVDYFSFALPVYGGALRGGAFPAFGISGSTVYYSVIGVTANTDKTKLTVSETHTNVNWTQKIFYIIGEL